MQVIDNVHVLNTYRSILFDPSSVWFPVYIDQYTHPIDSSISFFVVKNNADLYVINISHIDASPMLLTDVFTDDTYDVWTFDKKKLLHFVKGYFKDVDTLYYLSSGKKLTYSDIFSSELSQYRSRGYTKKLLKIIPLLKLARNVSDFIDTLNLDTTTIPVGFDWYNSKYIPVLNYLEKSRINIDLDIYKNKFPKHDIIHPYLHTEYNPFTATHRPSSRFGGINFAALNKSDGSRRMITGNHTLVQMDYDAYHVRIISSLIGSNLPTTPVHAWFAEQYGITYEESKILTFNLLYGNRHVATGTFPFFDDVYKFIEKHWNTALRNGYIETLHTRIPLAHIDQPSASKVFNYLIQSMETELNIDRIYDIINILDAANIYLMLYTYDSFIFNISDDSDINALRDIRDRLEESTYPLKITWGETYDDL
jgi:hypothetical protein